MLCITRNNTELFLFLLIFFPLLEPFFFFC
nr:MAG TPA: hypothetical protein [Caudoviricetes sp.]